MQDALIHEGIARFQTPLYILDTDELVRRMKRFREIFGEKIGLCYAMKANAFIVEEMAQIADRIEVCSEGEFQICRKLQIPKEKLYISGVLKRRPFVDEILAYGKEEAVYTVESPDHFRFITERCKRDGIRAHVFFRLSSGNQFGMDAETIREMYARALRENIVHVAGIHYFSGTQKKKIDVLKKEIALLDEFCLQLGAESGHAVEELEYGPGFFINYFTNQKEQLWDDAAELAQALEKMTFGGRVTLEMGRAFAASCGYYVTEICDCKTTEGKQYCIVDGGIHQLHYDGQLRGMYHPVVRRLVGDTGRAVDNADGADNAGDVNEADNVGSVQTDPLWTICGSLCTVNDVLVSNCPIGMREESMPLSPVRPGDYLVFERVGAYALTEGMSLFLSHELPAVAKYGVAEGWRAARYQQDTYVLNSDLNGGEK